MHETNSSPNFEDIFLEEELCEDLVTEVVELPPEREIIPVNPIQQKIPQRLAADWLSSTEELQKENQELHQIIGELQQDLEQTKEQLQISQQKVQSVDSLINQQLEEINLGQEHINRLVQELDIAHNTTQNQQQLIDDLTEQLAQTQHQIAILERESALLQEKYHRQEQLAHQTQHQLRELNARLLRQQQHTLRYKTTLDQYLVTSNYVVHDPNSLIPKLSSIQPWSNQLEQLEDISSELDLIPNFPLNGNYLNNNEQDNTIEDMTSQSPPRTESSVVREEITKIQEPEITEIQEPIAANSLSTPKQEKPKRKWTEVRLPNFSALTQVI